VKGLWLSWLVAAVIFAGLFFRELVSKEGDDLLKPKPASTSATRRRVFAACFLMGPFAEAATDFGVGQVVTVAVLHRIGPAPIHVVLLALFSQTLVS
jgi:lactate permease